MKEASSKKKEQAKGASSKGEEKSKSSKKRKHRSPSDASSPKSLHPQEPISAERTPPCSTQEPAVMDTEVNHLSLPQEPGLPEETREVIANPIVAADLPTESSLPQEPTLAEQVPYTLTQEPASVVEDEKVISEKAADPKAVVTMPEAALIPPSRDQLLRESMENDYNRVMQWQKWRTSRLDTLLETAEAMKGEEEFALEWIGTKDVYEALRLETIRRVYSYKVTNRTLGKDKAPICIELNKPPLDPAFVEEMKELRYAMLLSKIKTDLEKSHQNDPNCDVSGSKDESGREIDEENVSDENEESDDNEEEDEDEDADDEDNGAEDADDDDDSGNDDDNHNGGDPNYDSESPLLVSPDYNEPLPERSLSQNSSTQVMTKGKHH
ncbi:PREDICTED: pheromone-processing carboxypeptidase KEX1-like [Ipomoea nil]|uniref:pheromone-processing carboxypeptidase KEX1-like n=1 Tax=Ipomoea nil TaxID=35883 RepID=UPI000901BBC0|nr:PREDICTED: pheromone-processing carboxypeptidase KEX1-like [Ipomoea nil]